MAAVAYADDLIILSQPRAAAQYNIDVVVQFLDDRGMEVNIQKCTAMVLERVPKRKKLTAPLVPSFL